MLHGAGYPGWPQKAAHWLMWLHTGLQCWPDTVATPWLTCGPRWTQPHIQLLAPCQIWKSEKSQYFFFTLESTKCAQLYTSWCYVFHIMSQSCAFLPTHANPLSVLQNKIFYILLSLSSWCQGVSCIIACLPPFDIQDILLQCIIVLVSDFKIFTVLIAFMHPVGTK